MLDAVDSPWIDGCLEIGHSALTGYDPADFIRTMGNQRLKALHVHDVDYHTDKHNMPFMEKLEWESICTALGEIGYDGDFTFEADNFLFKFPNELKADACALMAKTGRYLISRKEKPEMSRSLSEEKKGMLAAAMAYSILGLSY